MGTGLLQENSNLKYKTELTSALNLQKGSLSDSIAYKTSLGKKNVEASLGERGCFSGHTW